MTDWTNENTKRLTIRNDFEKLLDLSPNLNIIKYGIKFRNDSKAITKNDLRLKLNDHLLTLSCNIG